jgi:CSLREA domain-containing protein
MNTRMFRFLFASAVALATTLLAFVSPLPAPARSAPTAPTFTVNSTIDAIDANPGDGACDAGGSICTLRAAIMEANHTSGGGATINFGLPGIVTYTLEIPPSLTNDERTGNLNITNTMAIIGNGAANTIIDGNGSVTNDGVFAVGVGITATISGVSIKNGETFSCGGAGGIFNQGKLTLSNVAVTGNTTDCLENVLGYAAGITNWTNAVLAVANSTISGNVAAGGIGNFGGGIYTAGPLSLVNSTVSGNENNYNGKGGGLFDIAAPITITNSTVSGNSGTEGGGLFLYAAAVTITNSTINGNLAENGGGIYGGSGPLAIINSTLSSNNSIIDGGGIFISTTTATLFNVTMTGNHANSEGNTGGHGGGVFNATNAAFNFQNSIIAGNSNVTIIVGHTVLNPDECSGEIISQGNNIMRTLSGCTVINGGGVYVTDPMLGPLADNGGPTQTHALLVGSPAINAGNPGGCTDNNGVFLTTDQRGAHRPIGPRCDIGAVEAGYLFLPLILR